MQFIMIPSSTISNIADVKPATTSHISPYLPLTVVFYLTQLYPIFAKPHNHENERKKSSLLLCVLTAYATSLSSSPSSPAGKPPPHTPSSSSQRPTSRLSTSPNAALAGRHTRRMTAVPGLASPLRAGNTTRTRGSPRIEEGRWCTWRGPETTMDPGLSGFPWCERAIE